MQARLIMFSIRVIVSFLLATVCVSANAKSYHTEDLRDVYLQAQKKNWNIKSADYQQKVDELDGYPLLPYFQLQQLKRNMKLSSEPQISAFLIKYQDSALDWSLRKPWLSYLLKTNQKNRFVEYYKPSTNKQFVCSNYQFQIDLGANRQQLNDQVKDIWLTGKSLPKECDGLLLNWTKAGHRSNALIWQRIMLAQKKRRYSLVKYLFTLLPSDEQYLVTLWNQVKRDPKQVAKLAQFNKNSPQETQVIIDGINRLVWKDEVLALSVFEQVMAQGRFNESHKQQVLKSLVTAVARSDDPKAVTWFKNLEAQYIHSGALQWRMANLLRNDDFHSLGSELDQLTISQQSERQWLYWQARAFEEQKQLKQANAIYQELAKQRSFYGFMAAAKVGDKSVLNHEPITIPGHLFEQVTNYPAGKRAMELFEIKQLYKARREWNYWMKDLSAEKQQIAAKWAYQQGWYDRGIYSLGKLGSLNDIDVRFPMPYREVFTNTANKYKVNPAWAYAIARKESIFMSDASSSVGALGLMQVMPKTANYMNKSNLNQAQILQPNTNVDLGIKYLDYLLKMFDNNLVLATAAYNAGPSNVKRWLKAEPNLSVDAWIETIPYRETRDYVKSVLAYTEIYQKKQGSGESPFVDVINQQIANPNNTTSSL